MDNSYDYKKYAILYVDDEEKSLKYFARAFEENFRVLTAANAQDGLKLRRWSHSIVTRITAPKDYVNYG